MAAKVKSANRARSKSTVVSRKSAASSAPKSPQRATADVSAETSVTVPAVLRRVSKGKRPQFHDNEAVDQLFAIVTALAAELSVAFDRMDTLERVLAEAGAITAESVESYLPTEDAAEARGVKREELIQRVFAVFEAYGADERR